MPAKVHDASGASSSGGVRNRTRTVLIASNPSKRRHAPSARAARDDFGGDDDASASSASVDDTLTDKKKEFVAPVRLSKEDDASSSSASSSSSSSSSSSGDDHHGEHKMGLLHGVLVPTCENMWGVLIFLRFPVMVGNAGLLRSLGIVVFCFTIAFLTSLSVSAIATNSLPKRGGAYTMISRSLGAEIGLVVGVMYYFGVTMLAVLEAVGAATVLLQIFPSMEHDLEIGGLKAVSVLGVLLVLSMALFVFIGLKLVTKISVLFIFVVLGSIGAVLGSILAAPVDDMSVAGEEYVTGVSFDNLEFNLGAHYSPGEDLFVSLALFFPCFTGILAGANRMEALSKPFEAVPRGTVGAVVISLFFYVMLMCLWATVAHWKYLTGIACDDDSHDALTNQTTTTRRRHLVAAGGPECDWVGDMGWPHPLVLQWGIMIASYSQALQCMVGAPRILQAIGADKLVFFLNPFAHLRKNGEPGASLGITAVIASLGALAGDISMVAPLLSMCFLHCYTAINASVFVLALVSAASWRPSFKTFHWSSALLGTVLCLATMLMIDFLTALLTLVLAGLLYLYVVYSQTKAEWGSGITGLRFRYALQLLYGLDRDRHQLETVVNWRPQLLVILNRVDEEKIRTLLDIVRNSNQDMHSLCAPGDRGGLQGSASIASKARRMTAKVAQWMNTQYPNPMNPKVAPLGNDDDNKDDDDWDDMPMKKNEKKKSLPDARRLAGSQAKMISILGEDNFMNYCLLAFVRQINKNGHGLCTLTSTVLPKKRTSTSGVDEASLTLTQRRHRQFQRVERRERALDHMSAHVQMRSFSHAVAALSEREGRKFALQALKLGSLRPNTALLNFPESVDDAPFKEGDERAERFVDCLDQADATRVAVVVCKGVRGFASSPQMSHAGERIVDVWWVVHDGGLMLYLAHILTMSGTVWQGHRIRLFTVLDPAYSSSVDDVQETLQEMVDNARINAVAQKPILIDDGALKAFSHDWTPRSKAVDESLDTYDRLASKNDARTTKKSKRRSIFDLVSAGMGGGGDNETAAPPQKSKLIKRISAVATAMIPGMPATTKRNTRRASLHMEIGSVIAISSKRKEEASRRHESLPHRKAPLMKRISAFMTGGSAAAAGSRHQSLEPKRAPLTKRISAFVTGRSVDVSAARKKSLRRTNSMMTSDMKVGASRAELFEGVHKVKFSDKALFEKKLESVESGEYAGDGLLKSETTRSAGGEEEEETSTKVPALKRHPVFDDNDEDDLDHMTAEQMRSQMRGNLERTPSESRRISTRTRMWTDLNSHIRRESSTSALVVLNMPTPMEGQSATKYMNYLQTLTRGVPRVILCHGTGREIINVE